LGGVLILSVTNKVFTTTTKIYRKNACQQLGGNAMAKKYNLSKVLSAFSQP
jgi:hypothetical protein